MLGTYMASHCANALSYLTITENHEKRVVVYPFFREVNQPAKVHTDRQGRAGL